MRFCRCCIIECVKTCFICKQKISKDMPEVQCINCEIYMHNFCYTQFIDTNKHSNCPSCNIDGTIAIDINCEYISELEL
jgi:hypothetical protein